MRRLVIASMLAVCSCGDSPVATEVQPYPSPSRTAAQDAALRAMVMDIAEAQACDALEDRFLPLPEDRAARPPTELPITDGRLWVSECRVVREDDRLTIHLAGRGWQWVSQSSPGPFGSSFLVRGTVRFEASADFAAIVDLRYDERGRRAQVVLTPAAAPTTRVTPIGTIPVGPEGGWSAIVGDLGGLLGASPEAQARPVLEAEAEAMLRRELARGLTLGVDLCTSQIDVTLGALADGQAPPARPYDDEDEHRWLDNARARVHAGGLDLSGPWADGEGALRLDVDVEEGSPVEVRVLCDGPAEALASSYLATGAVTIGEVIAERRASVGASLELTVARERCAAPHVLLTTASGEARVRYRVRREGERREAWVRCD